MDSSTSMIRTPVPAALRYQLCPFGPHSSPTTGTSPFGSYAIHWGWKTLCPCPMQQRSIGADPFTIQGRIGYESFAPSISGTPCSMLVRPFMETMA